MQKDSVINTHMFVKFEQDKLNIHNRIETAIEDYRVRDKVYIEKRFNFITEIYIRIWKGISMEDDEVVYGFDVFRDTKFLDTSRMYRTLELANYEATERLAWRKQKNYKFY